MKDRYKEAFMDMAIRFGQTSYAERLKVGCLLVKNGSIISEGVNGQPPKWHTEVCEDKVYMDCDYPMWSSVGEIKEEFPYVDEAGRYKLITSQTVRHSEEAALEKLWNKPDTAEGAEMFISHSPCPKCCIKILTAGIKAVYYREEFRDTSGLERLRSKGIVVEQI
jgi:dCMP deaminase